MKKSIKKIPIPPPVPCEWEDRNNFFNILICLVVVVSVIIAIAMGFREFYLQNKKAIIIDCKLLNRVFISGHSKDFISAFDCGNYGILVYNDKEVFRKAKEKENNKLTVYFGKDYYKILNI
jgi:hypothetical protein